MKVIAKMSDNMVLCEVSADEICRLRNATSRYDKAFDEYWLKVGAEHDLAGAYATLDSLRQFDDKQLRYLKQRIDDMQSSYSKILNAYEKLTLLDTLKEAGDTEPKT